MEKLLAGLLGVELSVCDGRVLLGRRCVNGGNVLSPLSSHIGVAVSTAAAPRFDCIKLIWGDAWNELVDNDHDGKLIEARRGEICVDWVGGITPIGSSGIHAEVFHHYLKEFNIYC